MKLLSKLCCGIGVCLLAIACKKEVTVTSQAAPSHLGACALLTKDEIQAVQKSEVLETKGSESANGQYHVTQCYFSTADSTYSVSVAITQRASPQGPSVETYWKETFERSGTGEEREEKEEHEAAPPTKVEGLGQSAYWLGTRVGGALYVLEKDVSIRISVGGPENREIKLERSKALAQKALDRL